MIKIQEDTLVPNIQVLKPGSMSLLNVPRSSIRKTNRMTFGIQQYTPSANTELDVTVENEPKVAASIKRIAEKMDSRWDEIQESIQKMEQSITELKDPVVKTQPIV